MKISAFVATSVDGFIARADGSIDWLARGNTDSDYGYQPYFDSVDALVIGRHTYQAACRQDPWPYGYKRVLVLSRSYVEIAQPLVRFVESTRNSPAAIIESLRQAGTGHVSIDGGLTIQGFIQARLLHEITITRFPMLLGNGISLFGPSTGEVSLKLAEQLSHGDAVNQCRYMLHYGANP